MGNQKNCVKKHDRYRIDGEARKERKRENMINLREKNINGMKCGG